MKKTVYTIAFIALFSFMTNAQSSNTPKKQEPAKSTSVNDDGTISPAPTTAPTDNVPAQTPAASTVVTSVEDQPASPAKKEASENTAPKSRMAITEKGVPASKKPAEEKKTESTKKEKH
jgi:hypothetical protein